MLHGVLCQLAVISNEGGYNVRFFGTPSLILALHFLTLVYRYLNTLTSID